MKHAVRETLAVLALVVMGLEKRLRHSQDPASATVPPLLTLERFLFRLVTVGFVLLTLTLASGHLITPYDSHPVEIVDSSVSAYNGVWNRTASSGPSVVPLPPASTDQAVWTCSSPK